MHEFNYGDGNGPAGELLEVGPGQFIGTTYGEEDPQYRSFGTIFYITSSGAFTTLHRFSLIDGKSCADPGFDFGNLQDCRVPGFAFHAFDDVDHAIDWRL